MILKEVDVHHPVEGFDEPKKAKKVRDLYVLFERGVYPVAEGLLADAGHV